MPRRRAVLGHRLRAVAGLPGDSLPALRDLADATARATSQAWGLTNLPLAPAFR